MLLTLPLRGEVNALSDGNLQPFAFFSRHTCSPLQLFLFTSLMLKHIHLDIVGPVPLSEGCTYIITFIDRFSHWPEAIPVQDISTETVAHTLVTHWIARFGMPKILTTDQSRQFESHLFSALRKILGIWHIQVAPYHSCINKMIEKFHCSLHRFTSAIMIFTGMKSPIVLLGFSSTLKEDLRSTCVEMLHRTTLCLPGEFLHSINCSL